MRHQRKVNLRTRVQDFLIPFLRNEGISPERRERVAAEIKTAKIATRTLLKYRGDQSQIPAFLLEHIGEYLALMALLEAADDEASVAEILPRIKQCGRCKKWFYARRNCDRFCPNSHCRQLHWAGNEGKEHRKLKAREVRLRDKKPSNVPPHIVRKKKR